MEINLQDIDNSKKELKAELSYEELTPHFDKAIENYRKKATIPGFRKGKAPLNMIKKLYGEGIEYSALEDIANEIFQKYLIDNKLDIMDKGAITDMNYKPKENLTFKISFEIMPEIKIEQYKGLELTKTKYIIDDSLVEDEIRYHRFRNSSNVLDGVAVDNNYVVTVDLQNLDEAGNILIGQSQKGMKVYLDNPDIYPEFKEGFKNIREGETRIIDSKNAEGNPKKVQATCTKVEKVIFPELNEEFFKKVTGKDNLKSEEEFRTEIKNELQRIYDRIADKELKNTVISEMIKLNEITAPEKYVEVILNSMVEDYKQQFPKQNLPKNFSIDEFKKERRVDAILQAKWYLLKEKLIETEKIKVEEEDYTKIAEENSVRYNIPVDKLIKAYKENEDVKLKILNDKVLDSIISNSNIKEVEVLKKKGENE